MPEEPRSQGSSGPWLIDTHYIELMFSSGITGTAEVEGRHNKRKINKEKFKMYNKNEELPTHEQITRRAYQIYLEHGFHPGNELADWLAAKKELTEASESGNANE